MPASRKRPPERASEATAIHSDAASGPVAAGDRLDVIENAERLFRVFVEEMAEPALIVTHDGLIRYSNWRLAEMLGVPLQSLLGKPLFPLLDSSLAKRLASTLRGSPHRAYLHGGLTSADGAELHVRVAVCELPGARDLASAIVTDLTEERRRERARVLISELTACADEARTFDAVLEMLAEKVCAATRWPVAEVWMPMADRQALSLVGLRNELRPSAKRYTRPAGPTVTASNQSIAGRVGTSAQAVVVGGVGIPEIAGQLGLGRFSASWGFGLPVMGAAKLLGVVVFYSSRLRGDDRRLRQLAATAAAQVSIVWERNQARQMLIAHSEELRRSNSELEQFAYIISHDLQEPLRTVARYVQLLERRYKDALDEPARECIEFAVGGARRMSELLTGVLDYSRATRQVEPLREIAVGTIVDAVLKHLAVAIERSGATIVCDPLPTIRTDPNQLVQVFQNLIANAIKFRRAAPPEIHISAVRRDAEWIFSVADNGIGIPEEGRARIFDMFQRLHAPTTYPGLGVGLAVCKRVVDHHHGRIWVAPNGDTGSIFSFSIPDAVPAPAPAPAA